MGKSSDEIADSITERREQEADLNRRSADEIEAAGNLAAAVDGGLGRAIATESSPANDPQGPAASERDDHLCLVCGEDHSKDKDGREGGNTGHSATSGLLDTLLGGGGGILPLLMSMNRRSEPQIPPEEYIRQIKEVAEREELDLLKVAVKALQTVDKIVQLVSYKSRKALTEKAKLWVKEMEDAIVEEETKMSAPPSNTTPEATPGRFKHYKAPTFGLLGEIVSFSKEACCSFV